MASDQPPHRQRIHDASVLLDILDHLPTSIFAKDESLRFIYSNEGHCNLIGQPEEKLLGYSDADFYPADEAREFLARDRKVIDEGVTVESEEIATGSAGVSIPVLTRKTRIVTADGRRYLIGTNTNLTEIRKREEQYRALAQTVPVGVWQVDEKGHTQFANPRFMAYIGIDTDALPTTDLVGLLGGARQDFPGTASKFETDLTSAMGDERRLLVISSGWLSLSSDGVKSAIVSIVDISEMTQLKRINDEILRLNAELAENMRKLRDAQDEIVRRGRMAQLGQLIATVAHEIRNPLGAVRTASFLLERKLKDKNLGVEQQLARIGNGVTRCDKIISQLLDFSRTKALQTAPVSIDEWLGRVIAEEAEKLPAAVTIECDFNLGAETAAIDSDRLSRVIVNLVSNASEAMVGKGDDPSSFKCESPCIRVVTRRAPRGVEIIVADNGPGMTPEIIEKVLEPLFTTKNFGTGLGLPAAEKILRDHHGGLEIHSAPGEGATFTAWLPLQQPEHQAA
jgi:PAS domain S-box-containing protein